MKNIFNIILLVFLTFIIISCRNPNDIPEDIHEHEEIEKLVVTLTNKTNPTDVQTVTYIGGISDKSIKLVWGQTYVVNLDFQVKHDHHYESVNEEIAEEKDEHFITYEFAGIDVTLVRSQNDPLRTDGNRVGLQTEWKVSSVGNAGNVIIKLVHLPSTLEQNFPSVTNQQGKTTGGETDVNANIRIN